MHYVCFLGAITVLHDDVTKAHILERPSEPPMHASQLHLLTHFADHRPHLFQKKLCVDPLIFDNILDQISDHPIFQNQSNNKQLPVAIQLAIFLNCAGHYGNASCPEDIAQWAGVSVRTVINCMNRVMAAILNQHDEFIYMPSAHSKEMQHAQEYTESQTCCSWRNGVFAADGSAINLFSKPGRYSEMFFDRKSNYLLNCQLVIMPHNLRIVDYALGQPGSVHDAYTSQGTHIAQDHATLIPCGHWTWADTAYPTEKWCVCVMPFKKPRGGEPKPKAEYI
ncbi:hypothetical protein PAXRUDRAFT_172513 [Paxillus rubicundulus Ve08.2h10]|uniref:DDE Tnp4 domain-containing protein n=1 Tax=Paxillus rubicundulus Ve08.2h10 TaxID=930991 RepID=A0A0D0BW52_9AGAM|nr:hypothetical protein PAXRUDRAFT_172513 [Paxillus rubicundulus Ve08.2h10]